MQRIESFNELQEILNNRPTKLYRIMGSPFPINNLTLMPFTQPLVDTYQFEGTDDSVNLTPKFVFQRYIAEDGQPIIRMNRIDPYVTSGLTNMGVLKKATEGGRRRPSKRRSRKQKLKRKTQRKRR